METKNAEAETEMIPLDEETEAALAAAAASEDDRPKRKSKGKSKSKKARKGANGVVAKTKSKRPAKAKPVKAKGGNGVKNGGKKHTKNGSSKAASTQGQSGPAIELATEDMNKGEKKVLDHLYSGKGERVPYTLTEIQKSCFPKKPGTSLTRNALRRLVRGGWAEKAERGTYRMTDRARKRSYKKG